MGQPCTSHTNTLLNYLKNKGATISDIVNSMMPFEKIELKNDNFVDNLNQILSSFLKEIPAIVCHFEKNKGGRKIDSLSRNFLIKIASIFKEATGKKATIYKSTHNPSGYDGKLYKFALMCEPLFKSTDLPFYSFASIGELSLDAMSHYKKFSQCSLIPF
jgi:hypothetical protein